MPSYGPLLSTPIIEAAAEETLRLYLPAYLGDALAQAGKGRFDLPDPTDTFVTGDEDDQPPEAQFNLAIVATPGTEGDADLGAGDFSEARYSATWTLIAGVVSHMTNYRDTRQAAGFYAVSTMCLAHKGLTPVGLGPDEELPDETTEAIRAASVMWRGEQIRNRTPRDSNRTVLLGAGRFSVWVPDARSRWGGPDEPPPRGERPPATPDQTPDSVDVQTDRVALPETLP